MKANPYRTALLMVWILLISLSMSSRLVGYVLDKDDSEGATGANALAGLSFEAACGAFVLWLAVAAIAHAIADAAGKLPVEEDVPPTARLGGPQ